MFGYQKELEVALKSSHEAGKYLEEQRHIAEIKDFKEGKYNYATIQDVESENIIIHIIRESFPDDNILSEESYDKLDSHERLWIIDPLDGTRNYTNMLPHFSVSIAFHHQGHVQLGVVYAPCSNNELFYAIRNHGSYLNGDRLVMYNPNAELDTSIVTTGFAYFRGELLKDAMRIYENVLNNATDVVRYGTAALELCYVAAGRMGAYYESGLKPWDIAAGLLILNESGGCIVNHQATDLDMFHQKGGKFSIDILATKNEVIKRIMLNIIKG